MVFKASLGFKVKAERCVQPQEYSHISRIERIVPTQDLGPTGIFLTNTCVHSEMVGCGPDQGRSEVDTAGVAALRRGCQPSENTELGRKMLFLDGH